MPAKRAITGPAGADVTFGELAERSNQLVHAGRALGLRSGSLVAATLPNGADAVALYLAALQAGWYYTPINTHFTAAETAYILNDAQADLYVVDARYASTAVALDGLVDIEPHRRFCVGEIDGYRPVAELVAGQPVDPPDDRTSGQVMLYTSGTTGRPKGVRRHLTGMTPEETLSNPLMIFGLSVAPDAVALCCSPLYHAAPLAYANAALQAGNELVVMDKWDAEVALALIEEHRVTWTHMVPTHFRRLLALPVQVRRRFDVSSLRYVVHAGAPCPVPVKQAMLEWFGPVVYEYYGSSEGVGGTVVGPDDWLQHPGTVGRPAPGGEIRVLDDAGEEVPHGVVGTVYSRLSERNRFEYFNDPQKTRAGRRGDFATVNDLGYVDEDGYLFLADRKSDLIISGGVNIYTAEIESVMATHPLVNDVAVFGVPDEEWGQAVHAVVELRHGVAPSDSVGEALLAHAAGELARFKLPRTIEFIDELPRDPNGKLYKRKLRERDHGVAGHHS